jgi:hypothetical protein
MRDIIYSTYSKNIGMKGCFDVGEAVPWCWNQSRMLKSLLGRILQVAENAAAVGDVLYYVGISVSHRHEGSDIDVLGLRSM